MITKRMKVPGGKLLVIKKTDSGFIIEGDFFLYPEEKLELLEKALGAEPSLLKEVLENTIASNDIEMAGITVDAICELMEQVRDEK